MKIWITRQSGFSIQCGGLQRLHVWFSKPEFVITPYEEKDRDLPFGFFTESHGYLKTKGWHSNASNNQHLSFGDYFGYTGGDETNNELATFIWEKLKQHFKNRPFNEWDEMDIKKETNIKDFLLEIDIKINIA